MKILYIITQADGGGAQKYTLALAKYFNGGLAAGHSTLRDKPSGSDSKSNEAGKLFTDAQRAGLETFELRHLKRNVNPWHDLSAVWEIRELIKTYQPDIVHLNSSKAGILGSFAAIGTKAKVVFTAHGFVFNEPLSPSVKNLYLAMEKIASGYRDYIITVSDADKQAALANKLIDAKKISTIHNGLLPVNFLPRDEARRELGLDPNKILIGTTSNFYRTKALDILINSLPMVKEGLRGQFQLVLIGDGPEETDLRLQIKDLRLEKQIILLGKINNAATYLRAFDLFALPSRKEGFPFALLEAMQAGLPIIASRVGGISEALGDAGILIEPENPQALANAFTALLSDQFKQKKLSQKALQQAKQFTQQRMLEETEKIYSQILN